jgi:hypothetical protein
MGGVPPGRRRPELLEFADPELKGELTLESNDRAV